MRILHLIPSYHPSIGGSQRHCQALSEALVTQGHSVTVVTSDAVDPQLVWHPNKERIDQPETTINGVRVRRFPTRHLLNSRWSLPAIHRLLLIASMSRLVPVPLLNRMGNFIPWLPQLQQWLQTTDEPFDLIGTFSLPYDALMFGGQQFARRRSIPHVTYALAHFGAIDANGKPDPHGAFYSMRHQTDTIVRSDCLIANSADEADYYHQHGMPRANIVLGGPGVDPTQATGGNGAAFRQQHNIDTPIVLSVGTLARGKGAIDNVAAIQRLVAAGTSATLVLIGSPTDEFDTFWATVPEHVHQHIRLLGRVDDQTKRDALAAADIFSLPSKTDSFGMVYLEAWLNKLPVIGAHSWGVRRVISDGQDGLLVPFGDTITLADAMRKLLEDRTLAKQMGASGFTTTMGAHLWETKSQLVIDTYQRLVDGKLTTT